MDDRISSARYGSVMQSPRVPDVLVLVATPAAAVGLVALDDAALPDLLWTAILFECLAVVILLAWTSARREHAARRTAERLSATGEQEAAQRAVVEERVLLAADIEAMVRSSTLRMAALAEEADRRWHDDPTPALAAVQEEGRRATDELRRMLGLLREAESAPEPPPAPPAPRPSWRRLDLLLGAGAAALALAETVASAGSGEVPAGSASPAAWALTALAAGTLGLRGVAPGAGAAGCGVLYLLGAVLDRPVPGGLWVLLTLGGLGWAAAARSGRPDWLGLAALAGCLVVALRWRDPENLFIHLVILGVAALGGAFVGRRSARTTAAREQARRREAELARAAEAAVRAERLAVARDLHDVVSHGVGVMVMQAGAAQAQRAGDPVRARAALDVVRQTAAASVAELDRLMELIRLGAMGLPLRADSAPGTDGLPDLVQRMRAAGLAVQLDQTGRLDGALARVVYRVVQEALTNALRYAPGASVQVRVTAGAADVEICVEDDGPGPAHTARRGFGLVGIAERVSSLGGELTTGPAPGGGGFRVHTRIPLAVGVRA
jgi:signal transduction histidine kinase